MALEHPFTCPLPNGMHARPASAIEAVARRFASAVTIANERTGQAADAASVLGLVGLGIFHGDPCRLVVSGPDEREAFEALTRFLEHDFPQCDAALPAIEERAGDIPLPRLLAHAGATVHAGTPVVPGIGQGCAVLIGGFSLPAGIETGGVEDVAAERLRIDTALASLVRGYDAQLEHVSAGVQADVLRAHRSIARDSEFRKRLHHAVQADARTGAGAIADAEAHFTAMLLASGSALLRERALDIRDVCLRLLRHLYGDAAVDAEARSVGPASRRSVDPDDDWVCVADGLTPGQFLALDRQALRGLVLAHGGPTSHTVILARSFGIPTLVGLRTLDPASLGGQEIVVDADLGVVVSALTDAARRYYALERARLIERRAWLERFVDRPATTGDGRRLEVGANVGSAAEASRAFAAGAEGIGLFRTEMLFLDRANAPSEEEQFEEYRRALIAAGDRPVIIRTLDVGGDKPLPYLRLPAEDNPFLGYRAVRLYAEFERLFRDQLRALVRASAFGRLKVMVPMVSSVEEVLWVRRILAEEQAACATAGAPYDPAMPLGAMVEVPSLAFLLDHLCARLEFFSIGSNDLLQYAMAVDRANAKVAPLYDAWQPAFLRLLKTIVDAAHAGGRWVGLCGEMGGQADCLPLLVGLGLDEISMAAPRIAATKAALAALFAEACGGLVEQALACPTVAAVGQLLAAFDQASPAPLIDPDLVVFGVEARSKEEAIKIAVDRLCIGGRTDCPRDVEEAVWTREATYSTGFGHGFAVPHARTDAVRAASLVVVRLRTPVDWGSLDDKPVSVLLLLTMRASDTPTAHLKILAALSRRLMHEEFRERLRQEAEPDALCAFLRDSLGTEGG
jgi:fructose-specific PTS system IIA-like component